MRFLFALVFACLLPVLVQAQTVVLDFEAFEATATRAQEVLDKGEASSDALEQMRLQLVEFRSQSLNQKALSSAKVVPIFERLEALGPIPPEGESEAEDVAELRSELDKALLKARGPVLAAEDAHQQADGLIKQIDALIRERSKAALLEHQKTPLNPTKVIAAIKALGVYSRNLIVEVTDNLNNPSRSFNRLSNIVLVCFLLGCALILLVRSRLWSRRVQDAFSKNASASTAAIYGFVGSLSQLILPAIGLAVLIQALLMLDLFGLRGYFLLRSLGLSGFAMYFAAWLARSLFVPTHNQVALVQIDDSAQRQMRRSFLALGLMFALREMLQAMAVGSAQNPLIVSAISTLTFPLLVVGGIALFRIGRVIAQAAYRASIKEDGNPFLGRITAMFGNASAVAGIAGPVLAGLGYEVGGSKLVFSTATSVLMVTGFYILFRLIGSLTGNSLSAHSDPLHVNVEPETQRFGALFRVAVGFMLICVALPFLALIWGARVSELQEVWLIARDGIAIGDARLSMTDFLTFVLIFSIGYTVTRVLQAALRTTVLPNTRLDVGGKNAIVTGTGYVGIFIAALAAITATGLDLSSLAIVAGALSVGIGFGLQTIVSNFVSGIILLVERPIKAGDWIEVGAYSGYVRNISVRSTEVETFDRATVVIPNADLIAGTVTNWTHSSMAGRVRVPVGVAYGTDTRKVEQILMEVAKAHPMVILTPPPVVMFIGFGPDSMDFEIRAILRDVNWMMLAKSDMNFDIVKRFEDAGIEIPFAQRDVNLKNLDQLGAAIANAGKPTGLGDAKKTTKPRQARKPKSQTAAGDE